MAEWVPEEAQACRNPCILVTTSAGTEHSSGHTPTPQPIT